MVHWWSLAPKKGISRRKSGLRRAFYSYSSAVFCGDVFLTKVAIAGSNTYISDNIAGIEAVFRRIFMYEEHKGRNHLDNRISEERPHYL